MAEPIRLVVNGRDTELAVEPGMRLSRALRDHAGLKGTKIGCDAGDCGACTVLVDGEPACACLVATGQVEGARVTTIEGLATSPAGARLRAAFLAHGAAQCGICTPGMLVSAVALLERNPAPDEAAVQDALGGVLCRCTGYRKIVAAVLDAAAEPVPLPIAGRAVGARVARLDGPAKVDGTERYGADGVPEGALVVRAIRSPFHRAAFALGDVAAWRNATPGVVAVLTAADVPGRNRFGVIAPYADQPVFAEHEARFLGEAVAAVVGEREEVLASDLASFPVTWTELPPLLGIEAALAEGAPPVHAERAGNVLVRGRVVRGDVLRGLADAELVVEGAFETSFVEHGPIEPEAGWARRLGGRVEVHVSTQSPYLDRDDVAAILGLAPDAVRIVPTACGGGFGTKLDLSVQPFVALAAWVTGRPCVMVYSRPESITCTTKRHPARIRSRIGAARDGRIVAIDFQADFDTGAYASWGPTVANRVPVHASGPYVVPHYRALTRAIHTHSVPSGAFRGFGVPQTAIAQEQLLDELALKLGIDPLELRLRNALDATTPTVTGQVLGPGVGMRACLEGLRPHWLRARDEAVAFGTRGPLRRGAGLAAMWYGCGNTSLSNPSTIRLGLAADGGFVLHQGAVDIGQGANTIIAQIAADALGVPLGVLRLVGADTDRTPDCGKSSASRQTFVTGKAAELAGRELRTKLLRLANAGPDARLRVDGGIVVIEDGAEVRRIDPATLPLDERGYALSVEATFDPPTTPLDADGQGDPYAVYGFGAHLAEVEVDVRLGTVRVLKITAAHDVGRAINPTLIEGQVEGGIAQGLGMALMEEFTPGRGANLHDYLIPTIGDVPPVEHLLIEDPSPAGPYGAKGIGEQALIPTAPAILNAIHHATGVRLRRVPATPDRVRAAILAAGR